MNKTKKKQIHRGKKIVVTSGERVGGGVEDKKKKDYYGIIENHLYEIFENCKAL